jgi:hypothetical protein
LASKITDANGRYFLFGLPTNYYAVPLSLALGLAPRLAGETSTATEAPPNTRYYQEITEQLPSAH